MRIISGKHKGRQLVAPKKLPIRPTTDMAKESLFNILNNRFYMPEVKVLDLFSGSGNISYEFASRGSTDITAVDNHFGCVAYINKVSNDLDLGINSVQSDVFSFLDSNTTTAYDIIFADPFYDISLEDYSKIPELVFKNGLLLEHGVLIIEHSKKMNLETLPHFTNSRKYSNSIFSFFE